jgi:DNA-binding SARP family transcriptional activator
MQDRADPPSPDAPAVQLDLLRRPQLRFSDGRVHALSHKDAALLAVLAMDGSCARDTLAALLWPQSEAAQARASLRQRRFRLARAAGRPLVTGEDTLSLAPGVATPGALLHAQLLADPQAQAGDWLEGLTFNDCPALDAWLLPARERWRLQRAQALARLASELQARGELARAIACAARLAEQEPLSDHAQRRLMRLHYLRGDLGAALQVYRGFAERLADELGELPDDETAALAASLRQGEDLPRAAAPLPASLLRPPRLVGREAAWQQLDRAWTDRAALVLQGSPGMGKSRLLADFLQARSGVLLVPAQPGDAERPYALLARVLGRLWFDPDAPWPAGPAALPDWARRELAALLPELGDAPPRLDPLRLQRALRTALQAPPGQPPLQAVALDDVQQADAATLELLPALAAEAAGVGHGTLPRWWLAVRGGEEPAALQAWMAASVAPRQVLLQPLDAAQLRQLLADLTAPAEQPDSATLLRYTGGIPLFVLETLRSLHQQPAPAPAAAQLSLDTLPPPAGAAAVVQARLQHLPEPAQQLAAAAAVLDGPFALADGAAVLGGPPLALVPALQALQTAQWLDPSGSMHDLVRSAVLQQLPEALRRWLHGRAAAWQAQQGGTGLDLARHWLGAGRPERAAPLLQEAALAARRRARPREEAALWDRAIAAFEDAGQPNAAFAAWRESIEARLFSAGPDRVRELTAALLQRAADDAQRLDALIAHAQVLMVLGEVATVEQLAAQALALARRARDRTAELRAGQLQATALAQRQHLAQALQTLDRLQPLVPAAPAQRYPFLATRSWVLHRAGRLAECAQVLDRAIRLAEAAEDLVEACTNSSNRASLLVSLGRYPDAWSAIQRALALRERLGPAEGVHHANVDLNHGYVLLGLGRVDSAVRAIEAALHAFERNSCDGPWVPIAANALAGAELMRGRADAAAARLVAPNAQTPGFVGARHFVLRARVARLRGQDPAPLLARAEALLGPQGDLNQRLSVQAERLLALPARRAAEAAQGLDALQTQARDAGHGSLAARLGWLRVERLLAAGQAAAAAAQSRALLGPRAPRPIDLLPQVMWALAAQAWSAAGDRPRAARARRQQAQAAQVEADDQAAWAAQHQGPLTR